MRIFLEEKNKIVKIAKFYFGDTISLHLFGSRVDDSKKGSDIDLFLESISDIKFEPKIKFLVDVRKKVIDRKIDLIIKMPSNKNREIFNTARETWVKLC